MSFVGPRPEIPMFVELASQAWRDVLAVRPGLIDPASLAWSGEADMLAAYADRVAAYREHILPEKLAMSRSYLEKRSMQSDLWLIVRAALRLFKLRL